MHQMKFAKLIEIGQVKNLYTVSVQLNLYLVSLIVIAVQCSTCFSELWTRDCPLAEL